MAKMEFSLKVVLLIVNSLLLITTTTGQNRPVINPTQSERHINLDINQESLPLSFLDVSDNDGNINSGQAQSKHLLNGVTQVRQLLLLALVVT